MPVPLCEAAPMAGPKEFPQRNDRITEIAEVLALGVVRLHARKSSEISNYRGESSLDCIEHQSGDRTTEMRPWG